MHMFCNTNGLNHILTTILLHSMGSIQPLQGLIKITNSEQSNNAVFKFLVLVVMSLPIIRHTVVTRTREREDTCEQLASVQHYIV